MSHGSHNTEAASFRFRMREPTDNNFLLVMSTTSLWIPAAPWVTAKAMRGGRGLPGAQARNEALGGG